MPPPSKPYRTIAGWLSPGEMSDASAMWDNFHLLKEQMGAAKRAVGNLTGRQRQVPWGVLEGGSNKQIARDLGISLRTVEIHRRCLMERLEVRTTADAIRIAVYAGLTVESG